jgi:hypothetical protein
MYQPALLDCLWNASDHGNITSVLVSGEPVAPGNGLAVELVSKKKIGYFCTGFGAKASASHLFAGAIVLSEEDCAFLAVLAAENHLVTWESVLGALVDRKPLTGMKLIRGDRGSISIEVASMGGGSLATSCKLFYPASDQPLFVKEDNTQRMGKLVNEIGFLAGLPPAVRNHFPEVVRSDVTAGRARLELVHYDLPSLRDAIIRGQVGVASAVVRMTSILDFLCRDVYPRNQRPAAPDYLSRIHFQRILKRLDETQERLPELAQLWRADGLCINGREYENIAGVLGRLAGASEIIRRLTPKSTRLVHGDLHFDNILIGADNESFVLVDPRGSGELDVAYDLGKILHSCSSLYDLIHEGHVDVDVSGRRITYAFTAPQLVQKYLEIRDLLLQRIKFTNIPKWEPNWLAQARFAEVAHMCSVMPFHIGNDRSQSIVIASYARAVELINGLCDLLPDVAAEMQLL